GDKGHDYRRADDGTTAVDEARVDELLARRLQCKMARQFDEADRIRDELSNAMGVEVIDREKSWSVRGGNLVGVLTGQGYMGGASSRLSGDGGVGHDYRRADDGSAFVDEARVNELLARRLICKMARQFLEADRIRDELRSTMGVERGICNRGASCRYSHDAGPATAFVPSGGGGGGGGAPAAHDYTRAVGDVAPCDVAAIDALIAQRLQQKMTRNYLDADRLRDVLKLQYGVLVEDREKSWRVVAT
ncbi:hypothetical protein M885DRAFT_429328, partial [Pelagophyceae sp. CCMP2097]